MPDVLTSWKEISDYFGKGVRTVQRWEMEQGLPVHRSDSGGGRGIFAIPEELDAWVRSHPRAPTTAVTGSLRKEIASLREEVKELREQLDGMSALGALLQAKPTHPAMELLRDDLQRSWAALRSTAEHNPFAGGESRTSRGMVQAPRVNAESDLRSGGASARPGGGPGSSRAKSSARRGSRRTK